MTFRSTPTTGSTKKGYRRAAVVHCDERDYARLRETFYPRLLKLEAAEARS